MAVDEEQRDLVASLVEPPIGLDAQVDAAGVEVRFGRASKDRVGLVGAVVSAIVVGSAIAGLAAKVPTAAVVALTVGCGLIMAAVLARRKDQVITIRERGVLVELQPMVGRFRRIWIPMANLRAFKVYKASAGSGHTGLIVDNGQERRLVAGGEPFEHLRWVVSALDEARRMAELREESGDREYAFQRHAPDEMQSLRASRRSEPES